eukprot:scaffold47692_cov30-Tisochrysis_lutea.AAC.5
MAKATARLRGATGSNKREACTRRGKYLVGGRHRSSARGSTARPGRPFRPVTVLDVLTGELEHDGNAYQC